MCRILLDVPSSHADIARKLAAVLVTTVIRVQIILGKYRSGDNSAYFVCELYLVSTLMLWRSYYLGSIASASIPRRRVAFGANSLHGKALVRTSAMLSAEATLLTSMSPSDTCCLMKLININKRFDLLIREDRELESCTVGLLSSMTTVGEEIGR